MAFLANVALFFVLYLPLTFLIGWIFGWYVGPTQGSEDSYPLFIWIVVVLPLLLPGLLWVPVSHLVLRMSRRRLDRAALRRLAIVLLPVGFLAVYLLVWRGVVVSLPLLVLTIGIGAAYGFAFRVPRGARA